MNFIQKDTQNIIGDKMKRLILIFCSLIICFLTVAVRIIYIDNDQTYLSAMNFNSKSVHITYIRGTVFDCNKKRLTNENYENVAAVSPNKQAVNAVSKYISETDRKNLSTGNPVRVVVSENFSSKNVTSVLVPKRYSNIATHIIGYCSGNGNGVCGVEKTYNSVLSGYKIKVRFTSNAKGELVGKGNVDGKTDYKGNGIMLTIDKKIQKICDETAKKHLSKGAIVVVENKSGKIRGITSSPNFDQNDIETALDSPSSPFFNRAISAYNCGSVFKLCVAAASLYYNIELKYNCKGKVKIGKNTFNCLGKHQKTDLNKALTNSCNCYFIKLGQKIGAKRLLNFAKNCGFGSEIKLCDDIISSGAFLPSETDLKSMPALLALFSFGQGSLLTSPLQIASLIQTIANGGKKITPSLVEGITDYKGNLTNKTKQNLPTYIFDGQDAKTIMKCMINCVENGTGVRAKPEKCSAGGKTATAETGIFDKNGIAVKQTWFGGFFPAENPEYTVVVLAENGVSGGKTAAPVFKEIADRITSIKN